MIRNVLGSRFFLLVLGTTLFMMPRAVWAEDPPLDAMLIGQWDGYDGVYSDLGAEGDYVYLGNFAQWDEQSARMHVIDIHDPFNPTLAATFFFPSPNSFASPQEIMVVDGIAYVALEGDGNDGVAILDVRDPTAPSLLVTTRLSGYDDTHNIFFADGFLYMCDSQSPRVGILDLRDFDPDAPPPSPITEATWILHNVGSSFVHEIAVLDGRLYCAGWNSGVWVYDVSDVANSMPTLMGSVDGDSTHSMWVTDDGKYMATGEERPGGGVHVYRITESGGLLTFELTDTLLMPDEAYSVHNQIIIGYRLYNAWYEAGLWVHDIDPVTGKLQLRSHYDTSDIDPDSGFGGDWGIFPFLGEDKILASDMQNGLFIVAVKPADCTPGEDCNGNANLDICDLIDGTSLDCNQTLAPDECELADGSSADCNQNAVPDECDLSEGTSNDCNGNSLPDDCDVADGTSLDCQPNGVPDECDVDDAPIDLIAKLTASDAAPSDLFGADVAVDGNVAVVGAWGDDDGGTTAGAAYVYRLDGADWVEEAKLTAADANSFDFFGSAVSVSGNAALVGAYGDDQAAGGAGAGYVFRYDGVAWQQEAKLTALDAAASDLAGYAVSIDGDMAVLGAYGEDDLGSSAGAAYVFRFDGVQWQQEQKLTAADGAASDFFGYSVAVQDDVAVVGAYGEDQGAASAGAAYVFRFDGATWIEEAKLIASDAAASDNLGRSVSVQGDRIIAGASLHDGAEADSGAAYVFRFDSGTWIEEAKLAASDADAGDEFGRSVDIFGGWLMVGAYLDDEGAADAGAAYAFEYDSKNGAWVQTAKLMASAPGASDFFGRVVAVFGNTLAVGAYADDEGSASDVGSVHVFTIASHDCNSNEVPDECDISGGDSSDRNGNGVPDECEPTPLCEGDANADGIVDPLDAGYVLSRFGLCP